MQTGQPANFMAHDVSMTSLESSDMTSEDSDIASDSSPLFASSVIAVIILAGEFFCRSNSVRHKSLILHT